VGLRAFELIRQQRPAAQLYLYYLTDELRSEMQRFIATRPGLTEHVHFRSRVPRQQMPAIYNSSDFLIQASYREWSGLAVLEAMSCGVIPAVTHIPSFWKMTDGGRYGVLFAPGDHQALAAGVLAIPPDDIPRRSAEVCAWFQRALSFPVLAQQIADAYRWLGRIRR
jgi:glycosyltransferase involved in cell wall biosynthesis